MVSTAMYKTRCAPGLIQRGLIGFNLLGKTRHRGFHSHVRQRCYITVVRLEVGHPSEEWPIVE